MPSMRAIKTRLQTSVFNQNLVLNQNKIQAYHTVYLRAVQSKHLHVYFNAILSKLRYLTSGDKSRAHSHDVDCFERFALTDHERAEQHVRDTYCLNKLMFLL